MITSLTFTSTKQVSCVVISINTSMYVHGRVKAKELFNKGADETRVHQHLDISSV